MQQGYCRRGEGSYRTWVEGVVLVASIEFRPSLCTQNLEWPRPNQQIWSWQQQVLPVCVRTTPSANAALAPAAA